MNRLDTVEWTLNTPEERNLKLLYALKEMIRVSLRYKGAHGHPLKGLIMDSLGGLPAIVEYMADAREYRLNQAGLKLYIGRFAIRVSGDQDYPEMTKRFNEILRDANLQE